MNLNSMNTFSKKHTSLRIVSYLLAMFLLIPGYFFFDEQTSPDRNLAGSEAGLGTIERTGVRFVTDNV